MSLPAAKPSLHAPARWGITQEEIEVITTGSRFLLDCSNSLSEAASVPVGELLQFMLNPHERKAQAKVSAQLKAIFSRQGRKCEIKTRRVLVEGQDGVWLESGLLEVKAIN